MKIAAKSLTATLVFGLVLSTAIAVQAEPQRYSSSSDSLLAQSEDDLERDAFVGTWHRTDVPFGHEANLCITKLKSPGGLYVRMRANAGGNEGFVTGKAMMQGPNSYRALMTFDDGKNADNVLGTLTFTMGQSGIEVSYDGDLAVLCLGTGVTLDGVYIKGQPNYIISVDPLRTFGSQKNLETAIKLVGEKNFLNLRDIFNNGSVRLDEPYKYSGFVRGTGMEAQVRADKAGHVYIFGRNVFSGAHEMVFYTNDKNYANKLPDWVDFYGDAQNVHIVCK